LELFLPEFAAKTAAVGSFEMQVRQTLAPPPPIARQLPADRWQGILSRAAERLVNWVSGEASYENFMLGLAILSASAAVTSALVPRGPRTAALSPRVRILAGALRRVVAPCRSSTGTYPSAASLAQAQVAFAKRPLIRVGMAGINIDFVKQKLRKSFAARPGQPKSA